MGIKGQGRKLAVIAAGMLALSAGPVAAQLPSVNSVPVTDVPDVPSFDEVRTKGCKMLKPLCDLLEIIVA